MATVKIADLGNDGPPCACGNTRHYRLVLYREGWRGKCLACNASDLRLADTRRLRIWLDETLTVGQKRSRIMTQGIVEEREAREAKRPSGHCDPAAMSVVVAGLRRAFGLTSEEQP